MCPPLGMGQDLRTSFGATEKPIFSFRLCGSLAQEQESNRSVWLSLDCVQEAYAVGGLLPGPKIDWRQLPLIIISGLLIGAIFGGAIKAFAPEQTTVVARVKPRP